MIIHQALISVRFIKKNDDKFAIWDHCPETWDVRLIKVILYWIIPECGQNQIFCPLRGNVRLTKRPLKQELTVLRPMPWEH